MEQSVKEIVKRLQSSNASAFSRQHLSNTVWACATLEYVPSTHFFQLVAKALIQRAGDCNPQEISNAVWAFAKMKYHDAALLERMAQEAIAQIEDFSQQNLSNFTWAYGRLSHYNQQLLTTISTQVILKLQDLSLQHISNVMWSFASLLFLPSGMVKSMVSEIRSRLGKEDFNAQQLSNLLWSLSISQLCELDIWDAAMTQFETLFASTGTKLPEEALTQIFQAYLLVQNQYRDASLKMPEGLYEQCSDQWKAACLKFRISNLHQEVSDVLKEAGYPHQELEFLTQDQLFSIDIALPGENIAIEVDGPHHFTVNSLTPLGEMLARQRLLEARGWQVVSVPFFDWKKLSPAGKIEYLHKELAGAKQKQVEKGILQHPINGLCNHH